MADVELRHFQRAAADIGAHGDNDTLPFDVDTRFIRQSKDELSTLAFSYYEHLASMHKKAVRKIVGALPVVFSERLLVPSGSTGFRVSTKIHPFWNLYFNGLGIAIAEANEPKRSGRAHAYRFSATLDEEIFDRKSSWRAFREATIVDCEPQPEGAVVVQTDIASFYEHVYHHRLENCLDDLFPSSPTVAVQIDRLLNRFSNGRSFGLPIDCWRFWKDRHNFIGLRSQWNSMGPEQQRMVWLAASELGDEGEKFRNQVRASVERSWQLGIERGNGPSFRDAYQKWCDSDALSKPAE